MRTLLGKEMLKKWKSISKDDDFMLEIETYMQEHYQCSIASIYQIWCIILYHHMNEVAKKSEEDEREYGEELHHAKKYHEQNMEEFNYLYEPLIQSLSSYPEYLKELEEEIKEYSVILSSPEKLENSMFQFIKNEHQELREYIKENGYDDVVEEWKKELEEINIETYKEAVLNWKKGDENDYNSSLQRQQEKSLEKQKLEYHQTFLVNPALETMSIEELENLKNQQLVYLLQRKINIESRKLDNSVNKHM